MASKIKRHKFSAQELSELQTTVQLAISDFEKAQKALAQLKLAKTSLQRKHVKNAHKYRYNLFI